MADQDEIELPDQGDNIIRTVDPVIWINTKGIAHELMVCMKRNKKKTAQIDAETGTSETFEQVLERSVRVAVNLRKLGVKPKDIITLCSTNHLNTSVVFYATLLVGAIPANIDPFAPDDERKHQLKLIKPKFMFAVPETVDKLDSFIKELGLSTHIVVFDYTTDHIPFTRFLLPSEEDERTFLPYEVTDLYSTAIVLFSSGTTGAPKGICLNHYGWLTILEMLTKGFGVGTNISFSSMVWFSGAMSALSTAFSGSIRFLCNGFTPEKTWKYLKQYKPTGLSVASHDYMALIRSKKPEALDLSHQKLKLFGGGTAISFASMVWFSATMSTLISAISGSIRLLCNGFTPEKTWRYLKQYKPTSLAVAPQDYMALIRSTKPEGLDLSHIRSVSIAGGGVSLQSREKGKKLFPNSFMNVYSYGQTELTGLATMPRFTKEGMAMIMRKPMMCGMPIKGLIYKVVDPDTEEILGPNQPGELRIKSKFVMNGYYNMTSHERFDKDGFLKTGDMLYYDEEHCFFFVERLKEALRYKMCTIAPLELENILSDHPSVKMAVVLGKPTDEGDLAFAVVVKNDDGVTAEELEQMVAANVDDRKRLRAGVLFVKDHEIPFTPSGKIRRRVLREYIFSNYQL